MNNPTHIHTHRHAHTHAVRIKREQTPKQIQMEIRRAVQSSLISALRSYAGNQPSQAAESEMLI